MRIVRFAHPFSGLYPNVKRGNTAKRRCLWKMHTTTESTEAGDLPRLNSPSIEYMAEHKPGEADGGGYSSLSGFTTGFPNALAGPRRSIGRSSKKISRAPLGEHPAISDHTAGINRLRTSPATPHRHMVRIGFHLNFRSRIKATTKLPAPIQSTVSREGT